MKRIHFFTLVVAFLCLTSQSCKAISKEAVLVAVGAYLCNSGAQVLSNKVAHSVSHKLTAKCESKETKRKLEKVLKLVASLAASAGSYIVVATIAEGRSPLNRGAVRRAFDPLNTPAAIGTAVGAFLPVQELF